MMRVGEYIKVAELYDVKGIELINLLSNNGYKIADGNPEEDNESCKTFWVLKESK